MDTNIDIDKIKHELVIFLNFINKISKELLLASKKGDLGEVQKLLKLGANPNYKDYDGSCCIMMASIHGHIKIMSELINYGVDVNMLTSSGETALFWATHNSQLEIVKMLLKNDADVNLRAPLSETPLMIACRKDRPRFIKPLLAHGANKNATDKHGRKAEHFAVEHNSRGVLKVLKKLGWNL